MTIKNSSEGIYKKLREQRIVFLGQLITDDYANFITQEFLFLEEQDETKEIYLYINSPGGSVTASFKIYDTIQNIKPDVVTVCVDSAAGMAGLLLAAGTRGKRICLSNSKVMLCQIQGTVKSKEQAQEILSLKQRLNKLLAFHTGKKVQQIEQDTETNFFLSPKDAKKYGIVDAIIDEHNKVIAQVTATLPSKNKLNSSTNNSVEGDFVATAIIEKANSKIVESEGEEHLPKIKDTSKSKHPFESNENGDKKLQRIFPPIQPNIYQLNYDFSKVTPDEKVALNLLNLSNTKLNQVKKLFGCNLDAQGKLSRLLHWHRLAIETELAGQWKQADFYWKQVQIEIQQLAKQDKLWSTLVKELAKEPGVVVMNNPVKMRQRLVDELFIDTHYNFYHSIAQQSGKLEIKEQAFMHIKYIEELVKWSSFSGDNLLAQLDYPWQKQINLYRESEKWNEAFLVCKGRLKLFPDSIKFQNELVDMKTKAVLENLTGKSQKISEQARNLKREINFLEKLLKKYPYNLIIYQSIAGLYCKRSIRLSANKQIAKALLDVEKALTYNPDCIEAHQINKQLIKQIPINGLKELKLKEHFTSSSQYQAIRDGRNAAKAKYPAWQSLQQNKNVVNIPDVLQSNPVFRPKLNLEKPQNEPFLLWIVSRQDMGLKMLAGLAVFSLVFTGGFMLRELSATSVRNQTYLEIIQADREQDYQEIIKKAEEFLTNSSFKGKDVREDEVRLLYAQAFIQWIDNKGEKIDNNDWNIINRYEQLNNN